MDLSNKIKNLGYSIEKDALVYFKSKLIGVCSNNNEIEELTACIFKKGIPIRSVYEIKESLEERYLKTMEDGKNA